MRIALLGDMALFGRYCISRGPGVFEYFREVADFLGTYDLVVGNLETPLCDNGRPFGFKSAHIRSNTENVELLKFLNVSLVNLANNHIFDYGKEGYKSTIETLHAAGIQHFGTNNEQLLLCNNENRVAFSGFCCYSTNACGYFDPKLGLGVNVLDIRSAMQILRQNHDQGYLNIASLHCGQEHVHYPNYDHVLMARLFAEEFPYVFYGHHPHVVQGLEVFKDSLIAYSLGNFCFDDVYTPRSEAPLIRQNHANKQGYILELTIEKSQMRSFRVIPISQNDQRLAVGDNEEVLMFLEDYSARLQMKESEYTPLRQRLLDDYLLSRKSMRDLQWYTSRMRLSSLGLILAARRNAKAYDRCVKKFVR